MGKSFKYFTISPSPTYLNAKLTTTSNIFIQFLSDIFDSTKLDGVLFEYFRQEFDDRYSSNFPIYFSIEELLKWHLNTIYLETI